MRRAFALLFVMIYCCAQAQYRLTIEIVSRPESFSNDSLFIAGGFNGWNPNRNAFDYKNGNYRVIFKDLAAANYAFKITRGSWSKVECAKDGSDIANREIALSSDTIIRINIAAWKDQFSSQPVKSTASVNVMIMDTAFFMPELSSKRRIWIYLPKEYHSGNKRYPVLYMNDGQNLFDASTGFAGEWGVDECLDSLKNACIVVGVDHGGNERLLEYNIYQSSFGAPKGEAYLRFLVNTLKPYVDKHYRTLKEARYTCIAGSSMGGLIAYFAVMKYPHVFGKAGVFSPSFWICKGNLLKDIESRKSKMPVNIFFSAGDSESASMLNDMKEIVTVTKLKGAVCKINVIEKGTHSERSWRAQLPSFFNWLLNQPAR
jgi:metallo-beta-lactamase class B